MFVHRIIFLGMGALQTATPVETGAWQFGGFLRLCSEGILTSCTVALVISDTTRLQGGIKLFYLGEDWNNSGKGGP
jgi:hypothetical protein